MRQLRSVIVSAGISFGEVNVAGCVYSDAALFRGFDCIQISENGGRLFDIVWRPGPLSGVLSVLAPLFQVIGFDERVSAGAEELGSLIRFHSRYVFES